MRIALFLGYLLISILPVIARGETRPTGKNCDIASPPDEAGEVMNHGVVLRVFPRAKDIGNSYTGCQVLFQPDGEKWVVVSFTEVVKGDPTRIWSPYVSDGAVLACRFKKGKTVSDNVGSCPMPDFLIKKSVPPGCSRRMQDAFALNGPGATLPQECEFQ
jgi:hypothetical protein